MSITPVTSVSTNAANIASATTIAAKLPVNQKTESFATRLFAQITPYFTKQNAICVASAVVVGSVLYYAYKYIAATVAEKHIASVAKKLTNDISSLVKADEAKLQKHIKKTELMPEVKQYETRKELEDALLGVSKKYMELFDEAKKAVSGNTKVLASSQAAIENITEKLRAWILYFENNRQLVLGAGANKTIFTNPEGDNDGELVVAVRADGGIGPMGGLTDMVTSLIDKDFTAEDFNNNKDTLRERIENKLHDAEKKVAIGEKAVSEGRRASYDFEQSQHVVKIATQLLKAMGSDDQESRDLLIKYCDDLRFDDDGKAILIKDEEEIAKNGATREGDEETKSSLQAAMKALLSKEMPVKALGHAILDDEYILRKFGITGNNVPRSVKPVMFTVGVERGQLEAFKTVLKNAPKTEKLVNDITHLEIADVKTMTWAEARRSTGVVFNPTLKTFQTLSKMIDTEKDTIAKFAYRYVHESMIPWKLTLSNCSKKQSNDALLLSELIELVNGDQRDIFEKDKRTHLLSFFEAAKVMFRDQFVSCESNNLKADRIKFIMYSRLSAEFNLTRVTPEMLEKLDRCAEEIWKDKTSALSSSASSSSSSSSSRMS